MLVGFAGIVLVMLAIDLYVMGGGKQHHVSVRVVVAGMYQRAFKLLQAREPLPCQSAVESFEREMLEETDLERIRAIAATTAHPLTKKA